jgi:hypothetical protein
MCLRARARASQESHAGIINAELFARGRDHVPLLLSLLEEEPVGINDFYVRYHTLQLLGAMAGVGSGRLQEVRLDGIGRTKPLDRRRPVARGGLPLRVSRR